MLVSNHPSKALLSVQTISLLKAEAAPGKSKAGRCLGDQPVFYFSDYLACSSALASQAGGCCCTQGMSLLWGCSSTDSKSRGSLGVSIMTVIQKQKPLCSSDSSSPFYLCCKEILTLICCGHGVMTRFVILDLV